MSSIKSNSSSDLGILKTDDNTNDTFEHPPHRVKLNNKVSFYSRVKFNKSKLKFEKLTLCNGIRAVQCRGGSVRNGSELQLSAQIPLGVSSGRLSQLCLPLMRNMHCDGWTGDYSAICSFTSLAKGKNKGENHISWGENDTSLYSFFFLSLNMNIKD